MASSWLEEEPTLATGLWQTVALVKAGLRRHKTLLVAVVLYGAILAAGARLVGYSYAPEYVLRVVEANRAPTGMPQPRRQLAEYVRMAVFTNEHLLDVMSRHGLYASLARKSPRAALQSFREDIDVEARQNYFVESRPVGAAPRSVRLVISYRGSDPEVASAVTRELGELVVAQEQSRRRRQAAHALEVARAQVDDAREALARRRSMVLTLQDELDRDASVGPERRISLISLLGTLPALELRQDECERREASVALSAAMEGRGIGMLFEVVDDAVLPTDASQKLGRAVVATTAFFLGLPVLAISVGAIGAGRMRA